MTICSHGMKTSTCSVLQHYLANLCSNVDITVADDVSLSNCASAEQPTLVAAGLPATAAYSELLYAALPCAVDHVP